MVFYLQSCLLVFFNDGSSQERAISFIEAMRSMHVSINRVQEGYEKKQMIVSKVNA